MTASVYRFSAIFAVLLLNCSCLGPTLSEHRVPQPPVVWHHGPVDGGVDNQALFANPALQLLLEEALGNNFSLQRASLQLARAEQAAERAGEAFLPTVSLEIEGKRSEQRFGSSSRRSPVREHEAAWRLQTSWELDLWGRLQQLEQAAQAEQAAAGEDLLAARWSLGGRLASAWYEAVSARDLAILAGESAETASLSLEMTSERYQAGLASAVDVHQATAALAAQRREWGDRRLALTRRLQEVELLVGRYPAGDETILSNEPVIALPRLPDALPGQLVSRRPDLRAAGLRLTAEDAKLAAAVRARLPAITLGGGLGGRSSTLADLARFDHGLWQLLGGLSQPLLDGGRLQGEEQLARISVREAEFALAEALLTAFREVEEGMASERELSRNEELAGEQVAQAKAALMLAEDSWRIGAGDGLATLARKQEWHEQRQRQLEVGCERRLNRIRLLLALGEEIPPPRQSKKIFTR